MYIPFVNSRTDAEVAGLECRGSERFRLHPYSPDSHFDALPPGSKLWLDAGFDGLYSSAPAPSSSWRTYFEAIGGLDLFGSDFRSVPGKDALDKIVLAALESCTDRSPDWISIPQIPHKEKADTNKANRALARSAARAFTELEWRGTRILPVLLTHSRLTTSKATRQSKLKAVAEFARLSEADGLWVVDASKSDSDGNGKNGDLYFPKLIEFMQELDAANLVSGPVVAGPYWGLGVTMWARGLATHVAAGCGNGYQYRYPGGPTNKPLSRLALSPLRKLVKVTKRAEFKGWLKAAKLKLASDAAAVAELNYIEANLSALLTEPAFKHQAAKVHYAWVNSLAAAPASGRALALYQDLSASYVRGTQLDELPGDSTRARQAVLPALQLMRNCL